MNLPLVILVICSTTMKQKTVSKVAALSKPHLGGTIYSVFNMMFLVLSLMYLESYV